ncbi:MAG: ATP-dependent DNA helicase RecG [Candidatus Doudnabacteria bacterium]|nr:ATP-dependent DNA helicase RecG [Candidatus Doudnabacteria bacterium]
MPELDSPIENFFKLQKPQIAALKKLGLFTARDVLLYFPYRYLDFSRVKQIIDLKPGENVSLKVKINSISGRFAMYGRMALAEAVVSDDTGSIKVVWFNQPYLAKSLAAGEEIFLAGSADYYKSSLQLTNPIYEKLSDFPIHTARLVPLYHLKQSIYPKTFRNLVAQVLPLSGQIADNLPSDILKHQALMDIDATIKQSHFPDSPDGMAEARKRLAFEEIFYNQLAARRHKIKLSEKKAYAVKFEENVVKNFVASLPFKLTADQRKSAWNVLQDMQKPLPMNRLLEGDVGSGKTLVALIAALQAISDGYQAVLLAPTEILASQHYQTAHGLFCKSPVNFNARCALITNNYCLLNNKPEKKDKLSALIKEGMPGLYIGTHALLQKNIKFKKLALVVIDEQHRFGVEQRAQLINTRGKVPHLLSLSATPIPRTLQLAVYGELDISQIKSKPAGRKNIVTKLVNATNREKAYEFITKQVTAGRQVFVITPLIEESDKLGVKSAKSEQVNLKKVFPTFQIGLMHGRLKGPEKEAAMKDFLNNKTQILVSTSVIEVGVDVPNASTIIIEGADRFGLAQLHQFRGRVGRAEHQSYCFLFSDNQNPDTVNRLTEFTKTNDGFELAELDLKQRGFGEMYGQTQSGWNFKYFDPSYTSLIQPARQEALAILTDDLNLDSYPSLKEKIKDKVVHFE